MSSIPRAGRRKVATGLVAGSLLVGLLTIPAAADAPPATGPVADRMKAVAAWQTGGPAVRRAAETALAGSDADVTAFVLTGRAIAAEYDLRARVEELIAIAGPGVREAATAALAGPAAGLQTFLDKGIQNPYEHDQRVLLSQIMSTGSPAVQDAANKAMAGTLEDVTQFLNVGQFNAREHDDRVKLSQLMNAGGPQVQQAANIAMGGGAEDVQDFLRYGYQTAAAHDQETLTVAQLADLTKNAAAQAGEQARIARDASAKALQATALAKQAAERAADETRASQADAAKASNAADRAADAAVRAAKSVQAATTAAKAANEAARQAAAATADAAAAAMKAGKAATRALSAAAGAAGDARMADQARAAAVAARNAAADARTAGEASGWAERASTQAKSAALDAESAGANAAAAAQASADAAAASGVSGDAADRARNAAARARSAAAEASRAAKATTKIADDAAAAARASKQAANSSAAHADAAAAAAEEAAAHAGDSARAAATAQAAATTAEAAAVTTENAAKQAHDITAIARASDQERLDAQQAAEVAIAQQAYRDEDLKNRRAAWEAGKTTQLAADTERLISEATAAGVDQKAAVAKGRQAAVRLLDAGGPWAQTAAQTALEGSDGAVLAFLSSDLAQAREQDDRGSVMGIAEGSTNLEHKLAAETASVGTAAQVRDFLTTGAYPGQEHDDRVLLSQIMTAGGPGVQDAANTAMGGTHADVRAFLTKGQYIAREHDNRVLITQAIASGGPEVKAAAQAAMAGPASGLKPFLETGLPLARQRDAFTAAHVATINSYLAAIDGSVALAREYAAQAAQSYATARGAANEAAGYANQAQASAAQAADWATKAANSAAQAKASADQAAAHAKQARTAAAAAQASARTAGISANAAAGYAQQAKKYAATAKTASDEARASKIAADKSAAEADQAAKEALAEVAKKQQADTAEGKMQHETATVDNNGRVTYIDVIPRPDVKYENVRDTMATCVLSDPHLTTSNGYPVALPKSKAWHTNAAGDSICTITVTVKVTGTHDYFLKTCPEPNLSIAACQGKYSTWDTLLLRSEPINSQYDTTVDITEFDYRTKYSPQGAASRFVVDTVTSDFVNCYKSPGVNASCAWAASNFIPYKTLLTGVKGVVAFRFALETGVELEQAKLALQATLNGYSDAVTSKLLATADAITAFRNTLKDGVGSDAALKALRDNRNIDRGLVQQAEFEAEIADGVRTSCRNNSFPAGTSVIMSDGTSRAIETVRAGDQVLATDPATGSTGSQPVTSTFGHPTTRLIDIDTEREGRITSTAGHRFYVDRAGWREVSDLHVGDVLVGSDGSHNLVTGLHERTDATQAVYDLTVDGTHTFYVRGPQNTGSGILVHNCFDLWGDELGRNQDARAHTIKKHVAHGAYGPNGEFAGVTPAEAAALTTATDPNGVFADLSIAEDALRSALDKSQDALRTWGQPGQPDFKEITVDVDVIRSGQRLTSLGKVYPPGGSLDAADAGTRVKVRLLRADKHNGKKWIIGSIFPLGR
ncbi:polymorphic toxin-type HINT domain-containing protein [Kitasatospora sp. NPDC092286]|uniref:polymorphic toxin-type HINT domain-containing protein n=1 Tax=Kitasatospora sp. NPDC092286 TaxID=3364087 RepID=UPI00382E812D